MRSKTKPDKIWDSKSQRIYFRNKTVSVERKHTEAYNLVKNDQVFVKLLCLKYVAGFSRVFQMFGIGKC